MAAYGKTRLQIINEVLPRLRQKTAATSSSTVYAALVATVLNTVKTQIEQAWMWRSLRDTFTVTAVPGATSYTLTSSGQFAKIIDVWNTTTHAPVKRGSTALFNENFFGAPSVSTGSVSQYNVVGLDSNYDVQFDVWPSPSATNTLKVNMYVPQQDPIDATVILVPNQVLIEGMVAYLIAERGDDGGISAAEQKQLYVDMLAGAVAADAGDDPDEVDFQPV